jgi:hypothetical protein
MGAVMATPDDSDLLAPQIRTAQIITGSIVMGALIFLGFALAKRLSGNFGPPGNPPIVSYLLAGMAIPILVAFAIVPNRIAAAARKRLAGQDPSGGAIPAPELIPVFVTRMTVADALLEGVVVMQLCAYLVEGQLFSLALAVVFLVGLALQFPTRARVQRWIERQQELLNEERLVA